MKQTTKGNCPSSTPIGDSKSIPSLHALQIGIFEELRTYVNKEGMQADLYNAEKAIFGYLQKMGLLMLEEIIARHNGGKSDDVSNNAGTTLPFHEMKGTSYISFFGKLQFERAYYWRKGESGFYPLDAVLNLPQSRYSYFLCEWVQDSIADGSFDKAIQRYGKLLNIPISKLCQENMTKEAGGSFDEFYRQKDGSSFKQEEGGVICIQADCKGVRMIPSEKPERAKKQVEESEVRLGKGEKRGLKCDAVVTVDYTFDPIVRTPEQMIKLLMCEKKESENQDPYPSFVRNAQVAASMDGKELAFERLAERIYNRDPCEKKEIVILIDGEPALELGLQSLMKKMGYEKRVCAIILDIMHVMEYVWKAATALYGEKNPQRIKWVRKQGLAILEGRVGRVIGALKQIIKKQENTLSASIKETLGKVITYFTNHKHMMHYDQYLAHGYQIATGMAEGACGSLVKDRAEISGARWSKKGVQAVLNLRAAKKNKDWESFWNFHMKRQKIKLYADYKFSYKLKVHK